jgi:hypothetical protein
MGVGMCAEQADEVLFDGDFGLESAKTCHGTCWLAALAGSLGGVGNDGLGGRFWPGSFSRLSG